MAEGVRPALGLSIGATNLAAVTADHAITRKPVLTLYRQRPPEVGIPSENPRLDEPGLVITDFVDRVGDRVGIVATDGTMHRSEALVADGLRALAYAATGGRALPDSVAVSYPAHWSPAAVDALGGALSRVSEWSHSAKPLSLIPDAAAALCAMRANPGIPARGIVAVCDFGGSGTSLTLVDVGSDYQPVAPTIRHHDFSGDLIDQSLLTYVMSELPGTGSFDPSGTAAIGSLTRLRAACRTAKERLSSATVTTLADEVPGVRGDIRLTRNELEETIRGSLDGVLRTLEQALQRNAIHGLVAIATVGGGANIPAVTTSLSGRFGVPVITTPRPQLTAAIGGALRAARGPGDTSATMLTPAAAGVAPMAAAAAHGDGHGNGQGVGHGEREVYPDFHADAPVSTMEPALAWSEAADESHALPIAASGEHDGSGLTSARPQMKFERDAPPKSERKKSPIPWYRLPAVIIISTTVAVLLVGTAIAIGLTSRDQHGTKSPKVNTVPVTPPSSAPASPPPTETDSITPEPAPTSEPAPPSTQEPPPPPPRRTTQAPPPPPETTQAPPPPTTQAPPPTPSATNPPPPTTQPPLPTTPPPLPQLPQLPQIPGLPQLPGNGPNLPGPP
ncbi:Hsp70 family protein [Mycobacterium asiaticum]|uniref:Molecular chaperone n=1 Tax=Mycobacterium asiaticum TaxID=1790 RepID=A0A1A3N5W5_MYCAS|nr:Hsp70 family protein [Mycobacterium asiaticum]OBK17196.1 hypothetical protein A5636_22820 [Mycobacterium asiaticum]